MRKFDFKWGQQPVVSSPVETALHAFHEQFRAFEHDLDVFSLHIHGIPVWERIRLPIAVELKQKSGVYDTRTGQHSNSPARYRAALSLFLENTVSRNPYLSRSHDVLVWGHQRRKHHDDGYWWDIYCDPIYAGLDLDYVHYEVEHQFDHHQPAKTERLRYIDFIKFGTALLQKAGVGTINLPDAATERLATMERELESRFEAPVELQQRVRKLVSRERVAGRFYDCLLRRVDPEVALLVVGYGKEGFIAACQRNDVPVVELQHGVLNEYHYGYDYPIDQSKEAFPDYIFTFGRHWKEVATFPIPDDHVIPVGYPYLELQRAAVGGTAPRDQLLFISSGYSVGKHLSRIAVDVAAELESRVVYKLHPNEYEDWQERYPWLVDGDLEVVDTDSPSAYELYAQSTQQVGVASTAVFEGMTFGLPTFVVALPGVEYFKTSIERGEVTLVETADELLDALAAEPTAPADTSRYFLDDPLPRIDDALDTVVGGD